MAAMTKKPTRARRKTAKTSGSSSTRAGYAAGRQETKKSALTREKILEAAARIFAQKGYGRTLVSEIAHAADVHLMALYYHFSTKEDVAEEVINYVVRANYQDVLHRVQGLPLRTAFFEKLRMALHALLESLVARRDYILAQAKVLYELPEVRQKRHRVLLNETEVFWRELLEEGRKAGALRGEIDVSRTRMSLHGTISWAIEWYQPGDSVDDVVDHIMDATINGIGARKWKPRSA